MSKKSDNIEIKGFVLANDKPLAVSSKALEDSLKTTKKIFDFKNQDLVEELIKSNKRKKKPEPVKEEEVENKEEEEDDDIEWSDVDENELSRTINELDQSLKRPNDSPVKSPRKSIRKDN